MLPKQELIETFLMPVPSLFDLTLPVLRLAAQAEINYTEAADRIAAELKLSPEEAAEMLPSGKDRRLVNRIKWAKVELGMAELVESTKPRHFRATEAGQAFLRSGPQRIDHKCLMTIPAYKESAARSRERAAAAALQAGTIAPEQPIEVAAGGITPQEIIDQAVQQIEDGLIAELKDRLVRGSPTFFEHVVLKLLLAMGYGRARPDAGIHVGGSGDGGIDGVVNQDPLGLDAVYIQAKRYGTATVGEGEIRNFVGSLVGRAAHKGVFVTTAAFTASARAFAKSVPHRIVLIDGNELARLMVLHGVGIRAERAVSLKAIDAEFFEDE